MNLRNRTLNATPGGAQWIGPLLAVIGVLGFSFKAILIKLAYGWAPIDAVTLLALRMLYAAPFFLLMAWWARRDRRRKPIEKRDWIAIVWLGFIGYYLLVFASWWWGFSWGRC